MKINNKELEKVFLEIKQNKTDGVENLYNKYKKVVYGIAFMISKNQDDAEDIMQSVFTKIYKLEKSKIPINNYASWLYSTTKEELTNSTLSDENIFKDETKNSSNEIKEEENIRQDINTNTNTNITQNNNINIQENTIYQEQQNNNYNQYIGYSFLSISLIFFIITLYFFIKYQPKHLKKLSK